jgi:hypothetical protein
MNNSTLDTMTHIARVQAMLADVCALLFERARVHDASKLDEPEKSGFDALLGRLANAQYGTDDYRAALAEGKPTIAHHYAANTHHPEHWPNGVNDMSLLDVIEMFVDWKAAGERTKAGSMAQSLAVNKERFGISDQLAAIFENTRKELNW